MKLLQFLWIRRYHVFLFLIFLMIDSLITGRRLSGFISPDFFSLIYIALGLIILLLISVVWVDSSRAPRTTFADVGSVVLFTLMLLLLLYPASPDAFVSHVGGQGASTVTRSAMAGEETQTKNDAGLLEVTDENYYSVLNSIYTNPEKFVSRAMRIQGFAVRNKVLGKSRFIVGKLSMFCCAADSTLVGIVCNTTENADVVVQDCWYQVEGILQMENNDPQVPEGYLKLSVSSVSKIPPHAEPYIYPRMGGN